MYISKQWLEDYVFLPDSLSAEEIADMLTMHTVEVEEVVDPAALLDMVVVGRVVSVEDHPDADSLQVCMVNAGGDVVQVVCGGSNVKKDMNVALGQIGAHVQWHGKGEPVELKKTKIRGVESFGMICAAEEIGLGELFKTDDEKAILDLSDIDAKPGTPLKEALSLDNAIFDIDNKSLSNRPDLWGHFGIAREIAALSRKQLSDYAPPAIEEVAEPAIDLHLSLSSFIVVYFVFIVCHLMNMQA